MIQIQLLEPDDVILATDWCRPLVLIQDGWSDSYFFTNTYSGSPMNNLKWILAKDYIPFWVGKKLKDYTTLQAQNQTLSFATEVVRGDIPKVHQFDMVAHNRDRKRR